MLPNHDMNDVPFNQENYRWSYKVTELINNPVDLSSGLGKFHWFYSDQPVGRTALAECMEQRLPNWIHIELSPRYTHNSIVKAVTDRVKTTGWNIRTTGIHGIIIDVPPHANNRVTICQALNYLSHRKLHLYNVELKSYCHIVVLANWPPMLAVVDDNMITQTVSMHKPTIWQIVNKDNIQRIDNKKLLGHQVTMLRNRGYRSDVNPNIYTEAA